MSPPRSFLQTVVEDKNPLVTTTMVPSPLQRSVYSPVRSSSSSLSLLALVAVLCVMAVMLPVSESFSAPKPSQRGGAISQLCTEMSSTTCLHLHPDQAEELKASASDHWRELSEKPASAMTKANVGGGDTHCPKHNDEKAIVGQQGNAVFGWCRNFFPSKTNDTVSEANTGSIAKTP